MAWANEQMKFADRVKAATGGKVVIQNMDEVKADNAVIDGIRSGVLDMGNQPIHSRGELVLPGFISMPFILWDKAPEMYDKLRPLFNDYWDKTFGVKYLGVNYFLPNNLFTNKPCTTLEDIKKMKLRINGTLLVQMFKAAGGSPIVMNQGEVFTSAQRGVIDGAQTAVPGYLDSGLYEVCKYMSSWPLGVMGNGRHDEQGQLEQAGTRAPEAGHGRLARDGEGAACRGKGRCWQSGSEGQESRRHPPGSHEGRTGQAGFVCRPSRRGLEEEGRT